jgi:hypothetical protein
MSKHSTHKLTKTERSQEQKRPLRTTLGIYAARVGMAAVCVLPAADLAASDAVMAKAYTVTQSEVNFGSQAVNDVVLDGSIAALIAAQSVGLGLVISKKKKLRGVYGEFDEYLEEREKTMSKPRRAISKIVGAPYAGLQKVGNGFDKIGNKLASRKSRLAVALGNLAIDTGKVNAMGTTAVIMQETAEGKPPSLARNARLGGLIAGSWIGMAEGIKQLYRHVPITRPPLSAVGSAFNELTTMNLAHPMETPVGSTALIAAAAGLAVTGWRMAKFHEERAATEAAEQNIAATLQPIQPTN